MATETPDRNRSGVKKLTKTCMNHGLGGIDIKANADSMVKCIVSINGKKLNLGFGKTTKYNFIMFDQAVYSIIDDVTPSDENSFVLTAEVKIILLSPSAEE